MSKGLPEVLGRYQILRAIGEGGIGKLYLARDPDIEREVAIKVLREGLDDPELRERFAREARSAGRLQHINIVTIYDVGKHEGQPYIAMEYVKGETLGGLLKSRQPTTLSRKFQIMEDLCSGLHYAHRAGVVHRDIKPGNIIISDDGILKILDFGIARLGGSGMTQAGMVMGTLNYMPPEQMEGRPVDARADMFSAGAVFYELLCFKLAFPGDLRTGIVVKILNGKPEPLEHLCPNLDPAVIALVNRCLEKQPDKRYADMEAVRRELVKLRRRVEAEEEQSQDAPTMISGQIPSGEWPATIKPTQVPPSTSSARPGTSTAPSSAVESSRAKSLRVRAEQLHTHVSRARHAIEAEDFHAVLDACQHALVLDPDNAEANDLEARARAALDEQQLQQWISEAREELNRGALTVAAGLVDKALAQNQSSPDAITLRTAVADALKRRAAEQARAREFADAMARAERELAAGSLDAATAAVDRALELQKGDQAGRALQSRIAAAVEAKRRADEIAHAKQAVEDARARFAAGDHSGALESLESVESGATIVGAVLEDLRREAKEIERKRLEAEAAAREQEEQERRRRAEEERRQKEEAEARRLAAEAAAREREEEARRQNEEAEARRLAAEAAVREQQEQERRRKAEVERLAAEAARREQEEVERRQNEEAAQRLAAEAAARAREEEARRQKEEAEARRLAAEAAVREQQEQERRQAEKERLAAEAAREEEARRQKQEADARRLAAETAERRQKEEQEARRLAAEAARKADEKKEEENRRRQEIALKTSEASASFRQQKFDEALALVRAALAIDPQHREAKALETSIAQAAERRRDASAALADARASVERAEFDAALKTLARVHKIDPGLQGIDEVRQAAEAGRAKAEAAERTRSEVDRLLARAAKALARHEWPRAFDEVAHALRLDAAHEGALKLKQQIDESIERERPAPAKRDVPDEPTIQATATASVSIGDEPTIQAAAAAPTLADEPTIQALRPPVADKPTIQAPRPPVGDEATIQAPAAWRESPPSPVVSAAPAAPQTLGAMPARTVPFPVTVPSRPAASEVGEAISGRAPAVERPATNKRLMIAAAAVIVAAVIAGTLVVPMLRREPATAPTETSAPGTPGTPGTVVLNIAPWATIDAITRKSDGQRVGEPNLVTPVVVALPPGEYHVKASNPAFSQALEFDLSVAAGGVQEVRRAMPDLQPEEEVTRILTSQ